MIVITISIERGSRLLLFQAMINKAIAKMNKKENYFANLPKH